MPINLVQEKQLDRNNLTSLERLIAAGMSFTGMYASNNLVFETKNLDTYFSPNGNEVTKETLHQMIEFFIKRLNNTVTLNRKTKQKVNLQNGMI